jgi:hypothetical protein
MLLASLACDMLPARVVVQVVRSCEWGGPSMCGEGTAVVWAALVLAGRCLPRWCAVLALPGTQFLRFLDTYMLVACWLVVQATALCFEHMILCALHVLLRQADTTNSAAFTAADRVVLPACCVSSYRVH